MIPKKYEFVLFAFLMSLFMTTLMSCVITLINVGWVENFFTLWFRAFWRTYFIAFPTILVVVPMVRKLVHKLVKTH
ncbi:DUF2798 domain-containing protein [Sulfurospirillum barnesii]|uniref:DUF2798 domain-containing protein n=1 Tax=Sulfurospirillum barnesii (strain ATCC 700032 / DSM 10660 / SES-3) TaxID=760154 RepID=I3XYR4_SULBS|nr:DUF2798 domain-containing protein [Sulfurospirillum barnesii]AFL69088.1 Protein of unknown function (DUF2798) [Sulfurospirillum barnesii SES-3]